MVTHYCVEVMHLTALMNDEIKIALDRWLDTSSPVPTIVVFGLRIGLTRWHVPPSLTHQAEGSISAKITGTWERCSSPENRKSN